MTKLTTLFTILFCAAVLFAAAAPASALPAHETPRAGLQCGERVGPPAVDAAKIAFIQSLARGNGKQPARSSQRPVTKAKPVECTSDGPMTTCCGPCGCCTWTGMGDGAHCKSWC